MTVRTNYHMHTTFCDGKNTPEQMVQAAVEKGFTTIGFSGHSLYPFSSTWHIPANEHAAYIREIHRLKECYGGKIEILAGYEADFVQGVCCPDRNRYEEEARPDYLIGAVHFVPGNGGYYGVDAPFDEAREQIGRVYSGDVRAAVEAYFECEREMLRRGGFQILAHCDLIRLQNSHLASGPLFSENESWYRNAVRETADEIARSGVCVEINTGAVARGKLNSFYPSEEFLSLLHDRNVPVTLSSDAHSCENLDFAFDRAARLAKETGYTEFMYLSGGKSLMQKF